MPRTAAVEQTEFHFWVDTLCVPVNDAARRKKTIETVHTVYQAAGKVLVLDSELFMSSVERPYEEVLTRVARSNWICRLQPLQEGLMTNNLLSQFAERAVCIRRHSPLVTTRQLDTRESP